MKLCALFSLAALAAAQPAPPAAPLARLESNIQRVARSVNATWGIYIKCLVIVSDNTSTDLIYDKVGGTAPVNALMETWGLKSIHATGTADDWFKALRAAPNAETFHRQAKTPFGLSSPRDMGKLLEMMEKGEAVSQNASRQMLQIMRGQVYTSRLPRYVEGYRIPHKTGDFMPYIGNDVGVLEEFPVLAHWAILLRPPDSAAQESSRPAKKFMDSNLERPW